ncbi:MAG: redoxin domain-containing protein [Ktedonobacteraceae bacterium]|nr:redoxin domain-containing protein [Ktedonobacteraceae bacterium]MBO0789362.1 redoxin domain-containing protein [Ktedonobacteraceae bacterium]
MTDNTNRRQPWLRHDEIIPAFTLPGADGMPHSPWDYKQRENLVLLFTRSAADSEGRGLLRAFARQYSDFREEMCAILAITADPVINNLEAQEALHLPFPLLSDAQGNVIARYTFWDSTTKSLAPSIVLATRYNSLHRQWIAENEAELPPITEILEWLQYLNRLCTP